MFHSKGPDGKYHIKGKVYELLIGTRAQVWHGTAFKTSGNLNKDDLFQNKNGRIVSKSKHASAKKEKRLLKHGYGTQKGKRRTTAALEPLATNKSIKNNKFF